MKVHIKKRVFEIISKADEGDTASKIFDGFIMALISLSRYALFAYVPAFENSESSPGFQIGALC